MVSLFSGSEGVSSSHVLRPQADFQEDEGVEAGRDQDRFLPIANIRWAHTAAAYALWPNGKRMPCHSRIMKRALPANAKIAKDSKETVQECVSEFISFITSECVPRRVVVRLVGD